MNYKILSLLLLISMAAIFGCKEKKPTSAEVKANKEKLEKLKKQVRTLNDEIASLESAILKAEGKPVASTTKLVTVINPSVENFSHYIDIQGEAKCEENIALTTDMGGLITKVMVTEGQSVAKGQVLATTDNSVFLKSIDEIDEQLSLAKTVYDKQKRLWDQGIGSQIQLLQAETNKNSIEKRKQSILNQMEKSKIKAPVNGVVDKVFVKVGELAAPGMPAIRVVNLNDMKIEAEIPETYSGKIRNGDIVKVTFPALDNKEIAARVQAVSSVINTLNRSFTATIRLTNTAGIKPNMVAKIKIKDFNANNAVVIPSRLLQQHTGVDFVVLAVKDSSGKMVAKKREIVLGKSYEGKAQILKGLGADDHLLDEGYRDVLEGDEITVSNP